MFTVTFTWFNNFRFPRKTLNNWPKGKTQKVSYEEENSKENIFCKQKDFKATKRQKFLRGEKPISSQRRLPTCVPLSDVMEDKDLEGAGLEIGKEKLNDTEKRRAHVDSRCFSDHTPRRNSITDTLQTSRRKSDSDIDLKTELMDQHLSEGVDQKEGEQDAQLLHNKTPCETCQLLLSDEQNNRVICTAC